MTATPALVHPVTGRELKAAPPRGKNLAAFTAGGRSTPEMDMFLPFNYSADSALLGERDLIAARVHDVARNDGWASSLLSKHVDTAIGSMFSLQAEPDWQFLGQTKEWADEWSRHVEGRWRIYAEDPDFWCDAARQRSMVGNFGLMYRHKVQDGNSLSLSLWLPERGGEWATAVQVVDPDRLSNPAGRTDETFLRGGIELGEHGEALAYHFRNAHPGDIFGLAGAAAGHLEWERVPRETSFGRRLVVHDFESDRAGQTRGVSKLAPILKKLHMLGRYDELELQASVLNALLAAFVVSPFDHEALIDMLQQNQLDPYQEARAEYYEKRRKMVPNGVQIGTLFPGEDIKMTESRHPNIVYGDFETNALRNIAACGDLSYEQLAMDFSKTNYSSIRAALNEVWKHFNAGRGRFGGQSARPHYANWLEEDIDRGGTEIPPGAPAFHEAKAAYTRCRWNGPGRGYVDQVREAQGALLRMEIGTSTLQRECAEQGLDWREVLEQRRREIATMEELGLPKPEWALAQAMANNNQPDQGQQN